MDVSNPPARTSAHGGAAEPLPRCLSGRYTLGADLGGGHDARVLLAYDTVLHRDVAIKLLRERIPSAELLERQRQEARLLASLNHRALTTLHDVGVHLDDPEHPLVYQVMERVPGADLQHRLRSGALDALQVCWVGHDLADGLAFLHDAGFLHRDVTPSNVLLVEGGTGRARGKLADMGIASRVSASRARGSIDGTPAYLAPEQVEGRPAEGASDVYSLGLVLIEALSGRRAYPGPPEQAAIARLRRQPDVPDDVPGPLAALLREMTARAPDVRPRARQAAVRLRELAVDELLRRRVPLAPDEEAARLDAVHRYQILDTPPEEAFDDVAALAGRVLHAPMALVSIVDRDRVWFKSRHDVHERQIDRHAGLRSLIDPEGGAAGVFDVEADPRTRDLVTGLGTRVRGCAWAPMRTRDGHDIGALCVLDSRPREFTAEDLAILTTLAAVLMRELELRLAIRRAVFNRRAPDPETAPPRRSGTSRAR